LWGIMLYGYTTSSFRAKFVGIIEHIGGDILSPGTRAQRYQKHYVNELGGVIGGKLKNFIKKNEIYKFKPDENYTLPTYYLNRYFKQEEVDKDLAKQLEKMKAKNNKKK